MKKGLFQILCAVVAVLGFQQNASATTHMVQVSDFQFTPSTLSIQLGDTIKWVWVTGTTMAHTTTSTTIPAGAASWDAPIASANDSFVYVPTVVGTYDYWCTPHAPAMAGSFDVTPVTGINDVAAKPFAFSYNAANNKIHFSGEAQSLTMDVYDINGRKLQSFHAAHVFETAFGLQPLSGGLYVVSIRVDGAMYAEKLIVP